MIYPNLTMDILISISSRLTAYCQHNTPTYQPEMSPQTMHLKYLVSQHPLSRRDVMLVSITPRSRLVHRLDVAPVSDRGQRTAPWRGYGTTSAVRCQAQKSGPRLISLHRADLSLR